MWHSIMSAAAGGNKKAIPFLQITFSILISDKEWGNITQIYLIWCRLESLQWLCYKKVRTEDNQKWDPSQNSYLRMLLSDWKKRSAGEELEGIHLMKREDFQGEWFTGVLHVERGGRKKRLETKILSHTHITIEKKWCKNSSKYYTEWTKRVAARFASAAPFSL